MRTLRKSVEEMERKAQQQTFSALTQLRMATQHYHFPADACTNPQVFYHKLQEFDADLVQHKHLEHNVLFPKVVQMEQTLLQSETT